MFFLSMQTASSLEMNHTQQGNEIQQHIKEYSDSEF